MEKNRYILMEWIINWASKEEVLGLEELIFNKDINYGLELFLGGNDFSNYLKEQARELYSDDISNVLDEIQSGDIENAKKLLEELLNK